MKTNYNKAYNAALDEGHAAKISRIVCCLYELNGGRQARPPRMVAEYGQHADATFHSSGLPESVLKIAIDNRSPIVGADCTLHGGKSYERYAPVVPLDPQIVLLSYNRLGNEQTSNSNRAAGQ